jgi:ribosomal protein S18/ribosomal protein S6
MKKLYELVILLSPQLSKDEQDAINAKVDALLGKGKKQVDSMGLVQLAHAIGKAKLNQAHITSYYCELDAAEIAAIKHELRITKGVARYVFFAMTASQPFLIYSEVNKKFDKMEEEKKEAAAIAAEKPELATKASGKKPESMVRKWYFNKESHNQELSWKSTRLLKYYITRFGDMKPRKFMGNSVSQQKKVRQAILRSRELGLIAYIN